LIRLIKQGFNAGIDHAGVEIGQPTSFFVGCALNLTASDVDREIRNLSRKLAAGADFILTQPVYQPEVAGAFIDRFTEQIGPLEVPILVGVLPLFSSRHASFLHNEVPGIRISEEIQDRLRKAGDSAPQEGVRISLELIEAVRPWARGVYLMPAFNRYDLAAEIVDQLQEVR
jgi:homocysteine S-methyltransferase